MFKKIHIFVLLVVVSVWTILICRDMQASGQEKIKPPGQLEELILPDLTVEKIEIETEPAESGRIKLTLRYTIYNNSSVHTKDFPTAEGKKAWAKNPGNNLLFKCTVEAKAYPVGNYVIVNSGTAIDLCGPQEKKTFRMTKTITPGGVWQFKVKADAGDWIREKNENNNEKTDVWRSMAVKKK